MANCPNCGRSTVRTQDWACQWCGYPLVSGFFKQIPMTYQEAKAERLGSWVVAETAVELEPPEAETVVEPDAGLVAETEPVTEPEPEPVEEPVSELPAEAELVVEPEAAEEEEVISEAVVEATEEEEVTSEAAAEATEEEEVISEAVAEATEKEEATSETVAEAAEEEEVISEAAAEATEEEEVISEAVAEATEGEEVISEAVAEAVEEVVEPTEPEIVQITIEEINEICRADSEAAEARFADVILQVIGVIVRIPPMESTENPCLIITNAEKSVARNLLCVFDKQHEATINQLSVGQMVTVQGKYDGCVINIILNDSVLVD